ncbi:MAG: enoyl-CoA hydratase/isomerase family protein [Actinomycetota bacterium]|nr:enoyl-CoA hydratase/isomerase family protein [Actinomycetota bacterium]
MDEPELLITDDGPVRVLTLNRPHRLNAFTAEGYFGLSEALDATALDDEIRVVLIRGAGRAYCAGVDLVALGEQTDPTAFSLGIRAVVMSLVTFPKPLVAAVHGPIVGFGATMLLHCDVVISADDARFRLPFSELGTAPEAGSTFMLPKIVGERKAAELLLTARWVSGTEAAQIGLATESVAANMLDIRSQEVLDEIAHLKAPANIAAKALLRRGWADEVSAALERESKVAAGLSEILGGIARPGRPPV